MLLFNLDPIWAAPNHAASGQQQYQGAGSPPAVGRALPSPPLPPPLIVQPHIPAPSAFIAPPTPPKEKSLDALVTEFLSTGAAPLPPPDPVEQNYVMGDPDGWGAALGCLARRRAWRTLVEVAGTMIVAHRGGGARFLTPEQVHGSQV